MDADHHKKPKSLRYISYVRKDSGNYYVVRVPKCVNGVKQFWTQKCFAESMYSECIALIAATRYRDWCIEQSKLMPSGLIYTKGINDLGDAFVSSVRRLSDIQVAYGEFRVSTAAFIGMFGFQELSVQDVAERLNIDPMQIRSQIRRLVSRDWLRISSKVQVTENAKRMNFYSITTQGKDLILDLRRALSVESGLARLKSSEAYTDTYIALKALSDSFDISLLEIGIMQCIKQGITSPVRIAEVMRRRQPSVSTCIKKSAQKGLIEPDPLAAVHVISGRKVWNAPLYQVTPKGDHLINTVSRI